MNAILHEREKMPMIAEELTPAKLRVVALETSSLVGAVAVASGEAILRQTSLHAARKHARDLIPSLKMMLGEVGWTISNVHLFLVDLGPGSYTGLRVGAMTARTFAFATGAAVLGVDSLEVLADSAPVAGNIHAIMDAQQEKVYLQTFVKSNPLAPPEVLSPVTIVRGQNWLESLQPGTYVTGPALEHYLSQLPEHCMAAPVEHRQPLVTSLWRVGLRRWLAGQRDDFWTLEPRYLRASSAEINWDARRQGNV